LSNANDALLQKLLGMSKGLLLFAGGPDSGINRLQYAILRRLEQNGHNIVTVEEDIGYFLEGIQQVQINPEIGYGMEKAIQDGMEQMPQFLFIGDLGRMVGTEAPLSIKAAKEAAGRCLVTAILPAESALSALRTFLLEGLGRLPLIAILSQKLCPRLCPCCREAYQPSAEELTRWVGDPRRRQAPFFRKKGCSVCGNLGTIGQIGVHELLIVNNEMRTQIAQATTREEIIQAGQKMGFQTMQADGLKKMHQGLIDIATIETL
jgi:type II secretory ATPase GspE/PulE/Tfp pilus assembly ATPase PilB-like protein